MMAVPPLCEELVALEEWLDTAEQQLFARVTQVESTTGDLLDSELVILVGRLKVEYKEKGFMKRRVQEGMEEWKAARPYASAVFFTLREKNNTVMNFLRTLEGRQQELRDAQNRLAEARAEQLKQEAEERAAARRLEAAAREIEAQKRQRGLDVAGNKLDLSGEARKNKLTEGRFVGSIYVGGEEERSEGQRDKSNSWRVKL